MLLSWLKSLAEQDATEQASGAVVQERSRKLLFKNRGPIAYTSSNYSGNVNATAVGGTVLGTVSGRGYSTTNAFGTSVPLFRGKGSVLLIKFK